jgi:putative membrane protein
MRNFLLNAFKGAAMGAANVIPGVSGGTIALITGIFERLINAIKSFNLEAIKLFFSGKWKDFAKHVDLTFLISVFLGIGVSIFSLARLLDFLFINYPIHIWSYFFGLIIASVYFVGKTITKWDVATISFFVLGTAIAIAITVLTPARENDSVWYVFICGIVAACSMILPGLSGSFVLILMGNYQLVMIDSINNFDFQILIPLIFGAGFGLLAFSYLLSYIFKKFRNQTIGILTGFILGSLSILWPWKITISTFIDRHGELIPLVQKNVLPWKFTSETGNPSHVIFALILVIIGFLTIWLLENFAQQKEE